MFCRSEGCKTNLSSVRNRVDSLSPHKVVILVLARQYVKAVCRSRYAPHFRREFCIVLLKLIQLPDIPYNDLYSILTTGKFEAENRLAADFIGTVRDLVTTGVEYLCDLIDVTTMDALFAEKNGINQYGVVGLYIRRVAVSLDKMAFSEVMELHKNIIQYYERGIRLLGMSSDRNVNNMAQNDAVHAKVRLMSKWSVKQAELFMLRQCSLLQNDQTRALPAKELQTKLIEIVEDNPSLAQADFLSFLNFLRLLDVFGSLDALHITYDKNPVEILTAAEIRGFQYVCLNLAVLHAQLNHTDMASISLRESIMLSQESGDIQCLEHADTWHCEIKKNQLLNKRAVSSEENVTIVLPVSLRIQFAVKIGAINSYKPFLVLDALMKSDDINIRHALSELTISSIGERGAIWILYGMTEIGCLYVQLLLTLEKSWTSSHICNGEMICKALCMLGNWFIARGEYNMASVTIQHATSRYSKDSSTKEWLACKCLIKLVQWAYSYRWRECFETCCQLMLLNSKLSSVQKTALSNSRGIITYARKQLNEILRTENLEPLYFVKNLRLLSQCQIGRRTSQTVKILSLGLAISRKRYLHYERYLNNIDFANALLQLGLLQRADDIINVSMEPLFSNGAVYDGANATLLFIKCVSASASNDFEKCKRLEDCLKMIEETLSYFKKLEAHSTVKAVFIFLAKFYHSVSLIRNRNKYACLFRRYDRDYPSNSQCLKPLFN